MTRPACSWVQASSLSLGMLFLFVLLPVSLGADTLRVLAIGQVLPGESPLDVWFSADPLVDYVVVPTDMDFSSSLPVYDQKSLAQAWRRFIRLYFPKTRKDLVEGFDFLVFPDGNIYYFTPSQIADIKYAIEKGVGSFVTMGGGMSSVSVGLFPTWINYGLSEVLPIVPNEKMKQDATSGFSIKVVKKDPPVLWMLVPFGIEKVVGMYAFTNIYPRAGATTWANLISHGSPLPQGSPGAWLVSWRFGSGLSWAVADDLDSTWWSSVYWPTQNKYAYDVFFNILVYSTGRPLPPNIPVIHDLRARFAQYRQEKAVLLSLLDFIGRFGANTQPVEVLVRGADALKERSFDAYAEGSYEEALRLIRDASRKMSSISADAVKLKAKALLWVYITEWSAVTGVLFASGLALYSLMIRRRVYREVETTRLRSLE